MPHGKSIRNRIIASYKKPHEIGVKLGYFSLRREVAYGILTMREKKAVSREVANRYQKAGKKEKKYDGGVFQVLRRVCTFAIVFVAKALLLFLF